MVPLLPLRIMPSYFNVGHGKGSLGTDGVLVTRTLAALRGAGLRTSVVELPDRGALRRNGSSSKTTGFHASTCRVKLSWLFVGWGRTTSASGRFNARTTTPPQTRAATKPNKVRNQTDLIVP
jgi:hypothetical protein